jgi:thiol-disulfide isomerase/thioredoxin
MRKLIFLTLLAVLATSCHHHTHLEEGIWRGELSLVEKSAPFLFELKKTGTDSATVTLFNGTERVELTGATIKNDSLLIPILAYDAYIKAKIGHEGLEGRFVKNYIENDSGVPFRAVYGTAHRFEPIEKVPNHRIDGKWNVLFINDEGDTTRNVGIFQTVEAATVRGAAAASPAPASGTAASELIVTGSILTSYGDLRFLEGSYTENGVQLSAFAGLSPYLLEFTFEGADAFTGIFYTTRGKTRLIATRNDQAGLADPYSLTKLKPGKETLSFSLPNLEGKTLSINDERYRGKVVIISILGSWCPNCLDEMEFLSPWYKANRSRGVEIIGLAFERKDDFAYAQGALQRLRDRYDTGYEIVFGGKVGAEATGKALPELEKVNGYPTTIFIDKQGKIRKIHTGFNGPATGLFHEEFKQDFNKLVDELVAE